MNRVRWRVGVREIAAGVNPGLMLMNVLMNLVFSAFFSGKKGKRRGGVSYMCAQFTRMNAGMSRI